MKEKELNKAAQELGRRGGKARAKALTAAQRSEIAKKAVEARIKKYHQHKPKEGSGQ